MPTVTCGELDMKRAGASLYEGTVDGCRIVVKHSACRDRSMLVMYRWLGLKASGPKSAQKQLCQLVVHSLDEAQKDWSHTPKPNHIMQPYQI